MHTHAYLGKLVWILTIFSKWFISSSKSNETKYIILVELLKLQTALKQRRCREIINRPNFMLGSSYSIITTFVSFICLVEIIKVIITSHHHHWHSKLLLEFPQSSPTFFLFVDMIFCTLHNASADTDNACGKFVSFALSSCLIA